MNSDFRDLLSALNDEKVKYLIVGGYAVIKHTEPRYTKDLDLWVSPESENAEKVFAALQKFGAPLADITVEDFTNQTIVYQMGRSPSRVDILMSLKGLDFESCWNRRVDAMVGNIATQFLAAEDLIVNKRLAGRPQDLIDVESLLSRKNEQ